MPGCRIAFTSLLLCIACAVYFQLLAISMLGREHFSGIFFHLMVAYDRVASLVVLVSCLVAMFWRWEQPIWTFADFLDRHVRSIVVAATVCLAAGALLIYRNDPLSMDEYAAVFQSKIFASGHLTTRLPPAIVPWLIPPGFNGAFLLISPITGRGIEAYWPGYALLLAPFQLVNLPWLCNATLGGLALLLIHRITLEVTGDPRTAGLALLFTLGSSVFWANAISYYSMQAHLTANLCFAWLLLRPSRARCLLAGLVGSLALVLHNPVPHLLFAAPWLIALATERDTRRQLPFLLVGYFPALIVGVAWAWFRGQIFPASQAPEALGATLSQVFVLPRADVLDMRTAALAKMWSWAWPGLYVFAVLGFVRARRSRPVRLLMWSVLGTFCGYLFVRLDQGHGWGYRYLHSAWGVLPILAACAVGGHRGQDEQLVRFAGAAAVLGMVVLVPFQLGQIRSFIDEHLALIPPPRRPGANVYFIDPRAGFYIADMVQMEPLLRSKDLFLFNRGTKLDTELVRQNWPEATRCGGMPEVDQWCLGTSHFSATDGGAFRPGFSGPRD